jgi:putative transposase
VIRTAYFRCRLPRDEADALNAESGRIYSQVLVEHYRIYRKKGVWLSAQAQERYNDFLNREHAPLLHSHSIEAAQQGFPKACKTTRAARKAGFEAAKYPHKRKRYRTTVWKNTGIRLEERHLLLALAQGKEPLRLELPEPLKAFSADAFVEARLVYNRASRHYEWYLVIDDGVQIKPTTASGIMAVDLREIHPAAATDGVEAVVVSARQLRSVRQHTNKRLAKFQSAQAQHTKGSRRAKRLQRKKNRFLARQEHRARDIEHKVSREVVAFAVERNVGQLVMGDVRDVADGKRLNSKSQQKISNWSHGKLREYIGYKAAAAGMAVNDKIDEHYTTQTCPECGHRHKPKGRSFLCPACGFCRHRDIVGASNILSRALYGELGKVRPPEKVKYRRPAAAQPKVGTGKRSMRSSPGHGASCSEA